MGSIAAFGGYGEAILDRVWALQIQRYIYQAFVGIFNQNALTPQVYFHNGPVFGNVLLKLEVGAL